MFLEYFRLREQPFGVTPDPRYLYPSPAHREALASLIYGIESNLGFGGMIADPGMGKTTLLFQILEQYRKSARTAFIFNTQCSSHDLLRSLLSEVDEAPPQQDTFQLHERFKQILATEAKAGRRVILVIDEAQNLGDVVMETVRLLSNFESAEFKLLHIILAGQPQLAEKLAQSERSQLQQRIPILTYLQRLSSEEIAAYIEHRLHVAGYNGRPLFTREALAQIAILSRGVPREINRLCFNCLSLACASFKPAVDLSVLEEVAADLNLNRLFAREEAHNVMRVQQGTETRAFANATGSSVSATRVVSYSELPAGTAARGAPLRTGAPTAKVNQGNRAISNGRRDHLPRKLEKTRQRFSVYRWPVRRRPVAFALLYLTLIAASWAAVDHWVHSESQAGAEESRDSQAIAEPSDAKAKTVNELGAGAKPLRLKDANNGLAASPARQRRGKSDSLGDGSQPTKRRAADLPMLSSSQFTSADANRSTESADHGPYISTTAQPELVRYVQPRYPELARDRHIEGTVVLDALVGRDGTIKSLKAVKGDPALLNAAESAVRGWVYRPYRVNGQPVEIDTEIVISFSLTEDHNF